MDYHVFILSRIREAYDRGQTTRDAIAHGIRQIGLGPAVAVLLDATVVRVPLLPALMQLLGERNWWLPRWLGWLPVLRAEPVPALPPAGCEPRPDVAEPMVGSAAAPGPQRR